MALSRLALLAFLSLPLAACSLRPTTPLAALSPVPSPCAQTAIYPVTFTPNASGYLASWPSPPLADATPGLINSQQVALRGNSTLSDLGNQGPLVATTHFSVHYSLAATPSAAGCAAAWMLECPDGSSNYAVWWAHSDPCVWNEGNL